MASLPSAASPITSRSVAERSRARRPSRKWAWSSATSTRICSKVTSLLANRSGAHHLARRARAPSPWYRRKVRLLSRTSHQALRPSRAWRRGPHPARNPLRSPPVIGHFQGQYARFFVQREADFATIVGPAPEDEGGDRPVHGRERGVQYDGVSCIEFRGKAKRSQR